MHIALFVPQHCGAEVGRSGRGTGKPREVRVCGVGGEMRKQITVDGSVEAVDNLASLLQVQRRGERSEVKLRDPAKRSLKIYSR